MFPELQTLFKNNAEEISKDKTLEGMDSKKQSWLWCRQMTHPSHKQQSHSRKSLVVKDNYYTRPGLSRAVKAMSDGEVRTIGTDRKRQFDA